MSKKSDFIKDILLMPIIVSKSEQGFSIVKDCNTGEKLIISGQKYNGSVDADMSDIAIEFYKHIYKLENILNDKNQLVCDQFAGDTINSYRYVTNRKGCSQKMKDDWSRQYHCLANFWILPKAVGRMLGKYSKATIAKDYLDNFLYVLHNQEMYESFKKEYPEYFLNCENIEDFYAMHGFENCDVIIQNINDYNKVKCMNADERINRMQKFVEWRATFLAEKYGNELENLFEKFIESE